MQTVRRRVGHFVGISFLFTQGKGIRQPTRQVDGRPIGAGHGAL
jgi:hypothetical protein